MPVQLLANDVCGSQSMSLGLSNGTSGFAVGIALHSDEPAIGDGVALAKRELICIPHGVFVFVPGLDINPLPNLPQDVLALSDNHAESIIFIKPRSKEIAKGVTGSRFQIPLMPAHAITVHKAQGRGMDNVIIDCGTRIPSNAHMSVYVSLSRVTTSNGLAFLGELSLPWAKAGAPAELLTEDIRLHNVEVISFPP